MRKPQDGCCCCCSVAQLCLTLQFHGLQHARLLYPSSSPGICSNSYPLSWWCHLTISSIAPFSSCPQSFIPGSFPMSWLFASGGQRIGVLALASVLPMNIQGWFLLGLTGLISLLSKGFSSLLQHYSSKTWILWHSAFFMVQLSHPYMTTGIWTFSQRSDVSVF